MNMDAYHVMLYCIVDGGLRVGDYITFKSVKYDCFLAGEGILLEDLIISGMVHVTPAM
jgi:hypothetical protein